MTALHPSSHWESWGKDGLTLVKLRGEAMQEAAQVGKQAMCRGSCFVGFQILGFTDVGGGGGRGGGYRKVLLRGVSLKVGDSS